MIEEEAAVKRIKATETVTNARKIDRLSDLPEHILHNIMFFLPIKDATIICSVSTKFRSAWACFPIIEFSSECANSYLRYQDGVERYLNFMHTFLQRRTANTSLQKFMLHGYFPGEMNSEPRIDEVIRYAFDNNVKDLELHMHSWSVNSILAYDLPLVLHPVSSVTVLNLQGFFLKKLDLTKFPAVEELRLVRCNGLKSLKVSLAQLKTMEVNCYGLWQIDIEKSNLRSFTFTGNKLKRVNRVDEELKLNMADPESLKDLTLNGASIAQRWFQYRASEFLQLENLILRDCNNLTNVCIPSTRLKTIEIHDCTRLQAIELVSPRLESFVYSGESRRCVIVISACKLLRNLELYYIAVTDDWVQTNVRGFPLLENLLLSSCLSLKRLRISHKLLKSLQLLECNHLLEAVIYTPSLVSFKYMGKVIASPLSIDSPRLEAELVLKINSQNPTNAEWYNLLREFLGYFDHCKFLTIDISGTYEKFLLFPEDMRNSLLHPLVDLKHLKVKMRLLEQDVLEWVKSLLWLSPLLKTMSIATPSVEKSIKFEYAKRKTDEMKDKDQPCCSSRIIKCWRHSLSKVSPQNFEDGEEKQLMEFFKGGSSEFENYMDKNSKFKKE